MSMKQIRSVPAGRGWAWIVEGFALFRRSPLPWLVLNILLFGIIWLLDHVPVAGEYIFYLLAPIFLAGMMAACRDLEQGRQITIAHLFRGFLENTPQLVTIGGVHLVGQVLVSGLMLSIGGPELRDVMREGGGAAANVPPELRGRILFALAVSMPVYLLLGMAMWFAPVLAMLDGQPGPRALLLSVKAILRNLLPFLVYSLASSALLVLALIPMGAGLILWFPVMILTMYASWRDVFERRDDVTT
jgi:hypothetical protein